MYDLIIGKQTMHDLGVVLDFKESTIQIDEILLPMRDIANLQLKTSISRALKCNGFEIKEGMKPYHGRAAVLMKEIDRLCSIGVLKWQPNSE